jgi:hypothetical protein
MSQLGVSSLKEVDFTHVRFARGSPSAQLAHDFRNPGISQ